MRGDDRRRTGGRGLWTVALLALVGCGGGTEPHTPTRFPVTAEFVQLDYELLTGYEGEDTAAGGVHLAFDAPAGLLFANVAAEVGTETAWLVENLPLVTCGGPRRIFAAIDLRPLQAWLGRDDVDRIRAGCTLTTRPLAAMPETLRDAPVSPEVVRFVPGLIAGIPLPATRAAVPMVRPSAWLPTEGWDADVACHPWYPNQECDHGECAPAAVSNGLKFLGAAAGRNDIQDCWVLTGFDGDGSPITWPYRKRDRSPAPPWEVETTILDGQTGSAATRIRDFRDVIQAIRAGRAIELSNSGHVVSVVAAAEVAAPGAALYVLHVAHDVRQGEAGGTRIEAVLFDPEGNTYVGGTPGLTGDVNHLHFTIQTPR